MKKNTIRLVKGERFLSKREFDNFEKGDCIWADGTDPEELKKWSIEEKEEALKELKKYRCEYRKMREGFDCIEYALEYYTEDEDGDFLDGSDYDFAEEA